MDLGVATAALDAFARLTRIQGNAHVRIGFYGGEPLLNWKTIRQALRHGEQIFTDRENLHWILNTNGTLLTPEIVRLLKEWNVDVHISLDGPDGSSNRYRRFKSGRPVHHRVRESLEIIRAFGCRLQLDSCLTEANLSSLKGLIDLAWQTGADRIYLALIDSPEINAIDQMDRTEVARTIVEAVEYGRKRGVSVGGPWKRAIDGPGSTAFSRDYPFGLVVDPPGHVYFPPYPERSLGHVRCMEEVLSSPLYEETMREWERETETCRDCDLAPSCNAYLKAMVMYHTGESAGYERECRLARAIREELAGRESAGVPLPARQRLVASRHLVRKWEGGDQVIIHRLAGTSAQATPGLLELLDLFREPTAPQALSERYCSADLGQTVARLVEIRFLHSEDTDEEAEWFEKRGWGRDKRVFQGEHFTAHYPPGGGFLARQFADLMEQVHRFLVSRGLPPLKKKVLILFSEGREELRELWGDSPLPEWVEAFVTNRRILVVDSQKILRKDRESSDFFAGMAHELVHIFLGELGGPLPVWVEEGLCEYYSRPYMPGVFRELAKEKGVYGFREMEALVRHSLLDLDDSRVRENLCYRQSHSFVSYLAGLVGEKKLMAIVQSTGMSRDFRSVFEQQGGRSLDDAEELWLGDLGLVSPGRKPFYGNGRRLVPSKNLRIIRKGESALAYNAFYGQGLVTTGDTLELLDSLQEGKTLRQIADQYDTTGLDSTIADLYEKGLVVFRHQAEENRAYRRFDRAYVESGGLIDKLRLNVSNFCNMSCAYCYVGDGRTGDGLMDWSTAKRTLDRFFELIERHGHHRSLIRFFGGEPLLNWGLIERILEHVETLAGGVEIDYVLNTNATVVTDKMAARLSEKQVGVAVSLDGVGAVHDTFRRFRSGQGSFAVVDRNLDRLLAHGCRVGIEATLGDHNYDHLRELVDYSAGKAADFDCRIPLALQSLCVVSRHGIDTQPLDYKLKRIIEAIEYAHRQGVYVGGGMLSFPFRVLLGERTPGVYCRAMGEELCVYPSGEVYPCGALQMKLGHIEDLERVFKSESYANLVQRVAGNIPGCRGCDIEAFCAGGCAADAVASKGDLLQPTENCRFEKAVFRALVENFLL